MFFFFQTFFSLIEKLVAVRGTVIRTSNSQLQCQYMTFKCSNCGGTQVIQQKDGVYTSPIKCLTKDCRKTSNFIPLLNSSYTRTVDYQNMQLQEVPGREKVCIYGNILFYRQPPILYYFSIFLHEIVS